MDNLAGYFSIACSGVSLCLQIYLDLGSVAIFSPYCSFYVLLKIRNNFSQLPSHFYPSVFLTPGHPVKKHLVLSGDCCLSFYIQIALKILEKGMSQSFCVWQYNAMFCFGIFFVVLGVWICFGLWWGFFGFLGFFLGGWGGASFVLFSFFLSWKFKTYWLGVLPDFFLFLETKAWLWKQRLQRKTVPISFIWVVFPRGRYWDWCSLTSLLAIWTVGLSAPP